MLAAIALGFGLSGCGGGETVGEALGYERNGPDEMAVVKRPPLIIPPDFNLRPPRPGEPRIEADAASRAAREMLTGQPSERTSETSDAPELALVNAPPSASSGSAADETEAILTGQDDDRQRYQKSPPLLKAEDRADDVPEVEDQTPSAGQTALLTRTNRVERDIDALTETRGENRIDGALLRRLLAWQPTPEGSDETAADGEADSTPKRAVQIVRRERKPVEANINLE